MVLPRRALIGVHPYELSYYNELIGGPRGAWERGFELSYWYDAFNGPVMRELNARLPHQADVDFLNPKTNPITFQELQTLGVRAPGCLAGRPIDRPFSLRVALDPGFEGLGLHAIALRHASLVCERAASARGSTVASVIDPITVSRAWAFQVLLDAPATRGHPPLLLMGATQCPLARPTLGRRTNQVEAAGDLSSSLRLVAFRSRRASRRRATHRRQATS